MFFKLSKQAKRRFAFIIIVLVFISGMVLLFLGAIKDHITYYKTPSELLLDPLKNSKQLRLGGLVVKESLKQIDGGYTFLIGDPQAEIQVIYHGRLPDLFKENQGVVALGRYDHMERVFKASQILVKHDQNYRPPKI